MLFLRFWELHRWTPYVQHFPQRHFGSMIALTLDKMLESLDLTNPDLLKFCVNDNASNMQKAIRESIYLEQYLCDNHTLQLVIRDTFEAVKGMKDLLKKTKDLAKMTHQSSSVANQQLKKQCKEMEIKYLKLKNPVETRWNSQEMNMSSVLQLKPALQVLFTPDEEEGNIWTPFALSPSEWKLLQGAVTVLKPLKLTTKAWEAEKIPTLNLVIERLYTMNEGLRAFIASPAHCR